MRITIEDCKAQVYLDGEITDVLVTVEIDTDRLNDAARRAYNKRDGVATWSDGAFRASIQDSAEGG